MRFTQQYMLAVWRVDGGGEVAIPFAWIDYIASRLLGIE